MNKPLLRYALLACVAYFCCMAVAHFFGIKLPLLFVYYDTPFHAYQDKIISFAVFAYIALFYQASRHYHLVPTALVVFLVTILGLSAVNLSDSLADVLADGQGTGTYWLQTGMFVGLLAVLFILYRQGPAEEI